MSGLAATLNYVTAREIEKNEAELANRHPVERQEPDQETLAAFSRFAEWCHQIFKVPSCPAKPATVAAWILEDKGPGYFYLGTLSAIEAVHDYYGFANPCATAAVRAALEKTLEIKPPRSWTKEEKISFAQLPADIRAAIERRESDRETHLRNRQNELAAAIKEAKQDSAETKPVELKEEIITNG